MGPVYGARTTLLTGRTASIKPRLLFSRAGYASWGLSPFISLIQTLKVLIILAKPKLIHIVIYLSVSMCKQINQQNHITNQIC